MENYRISQNPGTAKKPAKRKSQPPKRASSQSTSPTLILAAVVGTLIVVLGGVFWVTKLSKKTPPPAGANTKQGSGKAAKPAGAVVIPGQAFNDVTGAISSKQTQNLKAYYAKQVHVVVVKKGVNQNVSGDQVDQFISSILNGAQTPWNWHVPPAQLAAWQNGPNGQYFTGNVLVGISTDGTVISIGFDDTGHITTVFIAPVGDLTTPTSNIGGTGGSTDGTSPTSNSGTTGQPGGAQDSD